MEPAEVFWRDGFIVVRDLLPSSEAEAFRQDALLDPTNRDLLCHPSLRKLLLNDRLLEVIKSLIGPKLVYFGDSSINIGDTDAGFHKDNPDKDDPEAPDWQSKYPLVRFGIYAQNHMRKPNGLDLRQGSHEHCSTTVGKHVYADTRIGDAVIWNLRTSHSGSGMTVSGRPIDPDSVVGKVLRRLPVLRDKPAVKRVAFFGTFGAPGAHLDRYVEYLRTRQYKVDGWKRSHYEESAIAEANDQGITVRNMRLELEARPPQNVSVQHFPLPY